MRTKPPPTSANQRQTTMGTTGAPDLNQNNQQQKGAVSSNAGMLGIWLQAHLAHYIVPRTMLKHFPAERDCRKSRKPIN